MESALQYFGGEGLTGNINMWVIKQSVFILGSLFAFE